MIKCADNCTVNAGGLIGENSKDMSRCFSASTVSVKKNGDGHLSESFYDADQLVTISGNEACFYDDTPNCGDKERYKSFSFTLRDDPIRYGCLKKPAAKTGNGQQYMTALPAAYARAATLPEYRPGRKTTHAGRSGTASFTK